jgi:hypothetical protein
VQLLRPALAFLSCACTAGPINTTSLPGIERLTALKDLALWSSNLEPSCLLPLATRLTSLDLGCVVVQGLQASGVQQGGSQLLQLLARLTALRTLKLSGVHGDWAQQQLSAFSALTASSNLEELLFNICDFGSAVWAHVFPAGRKLPQLRVFSAHWDLSGPGGGASPHFGSADIARLASCSPALGELLFTPAADASLAPLRSLTALTSLNIGGRVSPAVIRSDLAALSQLRSLRVDVALSAGGTGQDAPSGLQHLVPLTALTGLHELRSKGMRLSNTVSAPHSGHACTAAVSCRAGDSKGPSAHN